MFLENKSFIRIALIEPVKIIKKLESTIFKSRHEKRKKILQFD
jgi:hypothetical protein